MPLLRVEPGAEFRVGVERGPHVKAVAPAFPLIKINEPLSNSEYLIREVEHAGLVTMKRRARWKSPSAT